ncbi:inositol 1,4,5-trisphosphate receptor-interacting protein-like 1 [Nyctibius grandis]|uniref:inositol 1,4,5-trisphosphate receptor-interacting protein-like 1 n=1 Tax=Nyctibius grandis TaxID=48427 RepID=UPI0035BBE1B8
MAATKFFTVLVQSIIQLPQMVGDELDEATQERMKRREEQLSQEMTRLLQELEQRSLELKSQELRSQEQSGFAWGALLFAALQTWQFWAFAGVPVLLFGLCKWLRKSSPEPESRSKEEEEEKQEESEEDPKRIQWPVQDLAYRMQVEEELLCVFQVPLFNRFFPKMQPAIKVGSAFEGWSPCADDTVYHLLVPLKPPCGHAFHLEQGTEQDMPVRNFRVRVELVCTCTREQLVENMLCFVHHPEEELRRNQDPSLLCTLCTGSYLDVQKTACWFQNVVMSSLTSLWPQTHHYKMKMLPATRSCKLQLTDSFRRTFFVEMMFGVQQGNSDIFVSSQSIENAESIFTPRTTWPESYAVAEVKFFKHVARQAPCDSCHLECLELCARTLVGRNFSTYTLKTVVMHLLTTIPLSVWCKRDFLLRLGDIGRCLRRSLEEARLNHFFFGNARVPKEIVLPLDFQMAEPLNLFQHLMQDPIAHTEALREFYDLEYWFTRRLWFYSR